MARSAVDATRPAKSSVFRPARSFAGAIHILAPEQRGWSQCPFCGWPLLLPLLGRRLRRWGPTQCPRRRLWVASNVLFAFGYRITYRSPNSTTPAGVAWFRLSTGGPLDVWPSTPPGALPPAACAFHRSEPSSRRWLWDQTP